MSFLEVFTLFASGITSFGVIVGVFSIYNGRMTRREIGGLIGQTQELIAREAENTRQLIRETQQETQQLIRETQRETRELIAREAEANRQVLQGITAILGRIDERVR
jgi:hypothetical protein